MSSAFARFWQTDLTREPFLEQLTKDELCSLRLLSRGIAEDVGAVLFKTIEIQFNVSSFTRRPRMLALESIGHHTRHLRFVLPHSDATFLPPLIDPDTLEEINYEPQSTYSSRPSSSSSAESPSTKYGSWQLSDLLVRQYPPLFHAATNVSSFIQAFSALPFLRHLTISSPDQPIGHRYRRSVVDYALISLRLALEAVNPPELDYLTLDPIYPSAIFYLRPHSGIGTSPASTRLWHRISKVNITMQSLSQNEDDTTDHLKILHTYLQNFRSVRTLSFKWLGEPGPCPFSLDAEPCTSRPSSLDCSTSCPITSTLPACRPIKFRKLRAMQLENAVLDASQASRFISTHRKSIRDIDFSACILRSGTWDDALSPLEDMAINDDWRSEASKSTSSSQFSEVMDVPIFYTPMEEISNPFDYVADALWDPTDRDITRAVNKVAKDVFKNVKMYRKRDVVACGIKTLLRSFKSNGHKMPLII